MTDFLPVLSISPEQLQRLIAVMLVYKHYRAEKTSPTEEQKRTLSILAKLIPKLSQRGGLTEEVAPLWLTVDEVCVMKGGLDALLKRLSKELPSGKIEKEIQQLQELQVIILQFRTTSD